MHFAVASGSAEAKVQPTEQKEISVIGEAQEPAKISM